MADLAQAAVGVRTKGMLVPWCFRALWQPRIWASSQTAG